MKNIKLFNEFKNLNENMETGNIVALCVVAIPILGWAGWAGTILVQNFFSNMKYKRESKKIYEIFNKYKDDSVISSILLEYSKLQHFGEEESDGSKQEHYSEKRNKELSEIVNKRLKELMSDGEYQLFKKYKSYIVTSLKNKFRGENPEEYNKYTNYVPEWDKDTMVDKFLEDASEFAGFQEGYKSRNWRSRVKPIIENKWIIENDSIVLESMGEEEEGDDDVVYLDEITNEFIWEITKNSFSQGYHERNFREFLSHMITNKGYSVKLKN